MNYQVIITTGYGKYPEEFEKDVINILKNSGVKAFSYQSVKGFKNDKNEMKNWFGKDDITVDSLLITVF